MYKRQIQNEQDLLNDTGDETTTFQRAFINGRVGGVKVEAGRNNASILGGEILSHRADRVKASYGKDITLSVEGGKLASDTGAKTYEYDEVNKKVVAKDGTSIGEEYYAVSLAGKVGKLGLEAAYVDYKDDSKLEEDNNIWALAANYRFDEDWAVRAAYLKGDVENAEGEDDGYYVGVNYKGAKAAKAGTWGLYATYYDMAASTYISNGWESSVANKLRGEGAGGYEGWKIGGNVALAKNIVAAVEYHKFDAKEDSKNDTETLWSEVIFTF